MILLADSEGPDQTARMRRLIWAFAVRICTKILFAWRAQYDIAFKIIVLTVFVYEQLGNKDYIVFDVC